MRVHLVRRLLAWSKYYDAALGPLLFKLGRGNGKPNAAKVFAEKLARRGWVHMPNGAQVEFLDVDGEFHGVDS